MTYILFTVAWSCPSLFGLSVIPKSLQPIVCVQKPVLEAIPDHEAMRRLDKLGPESGARLFEFVDRGKLHEVTFKWAMVLPEERK